MGVEIERRFLVENINWKQGLAVGISSINQGYLSRDIKTIVRVRIEESNSQTNAYITIKGPGTGASRPEWEYAIPAEEALEMYTTLCSNTVAKTRYTWVDDNQKLWHVDEFAKDNQGLIIAEIELQSEDEQIAIPSWAKLEITNDHRYSNAALAQTPFSTWIKIDS
jgi:CYTH domain-containing protein